MKNLKNCLTCGQEFEAVRSDQKYCSDACRKRFHKENEKLNQGLALVEQENQSAPVPADVCFKSDDFWEGRMEEFRYYQEDLAFREDQVARRLKEVSKREQDFAELQMNLRDAQKELQFERRETKRLQSELSDKDKKIAALEKQIIDLQKAKKSNVWDKFADKGADFLTTFGGSYAATKFSQNQSKDAQKKAEKVKNAFGAFGNLFNEG